MELNECSGDLHCPRQNFLNELPPHSEPERLEISLIKLLSFKFPLLSFSQEAENTHFKAYTEVTHYSNCKETYLVTHPNVILSDSFSLMPEDFLNSPNVFLTLLLSFNCNFIEEKQ